MERSGLRNMLGVSALVLGLFLAFGWEDADGMPPANSMTTKKNGFSCPPMPNAGTNNTNAKILNGDFGGDFFAFDLENDNPTAVYICGANAGYADGGIKGATEVAASCPKRCSTCAAGAVYAPDVQAWNTQLIASRNDAGLTTQVKMPDAYCFSANNDAGVVVKINFFR